MEAEFMCDCGRLRKENQQLQSSNAKFLEELEAANHDYTELMKERADYMTENKQLETRLKESRKLGKGHKDRELANAQKCNEYYDENKKLKKEIECLIVIIKRTAEGKIKLSKP